MTCIIRQLPPLPRVMVSFIIKQQYELLLIVTDIFKMLIIVDNLTTDNWNMTTDH